RGSMPLDLRAHPRGRRSTATQVLGAAALAFLLAGCGATGLTAGSNSAGAQTSSPTAAPTPASTAASTGQAAQTPVNLVSSMPCSSSSQQVNDIGRPTYVLTPNTPGHAVDVHVGDTLQVRLSSASRWSFRVASNAAVLTAIAPTGIYAPTL